MSANLAAIANAILHPSLEKGENGHAQFTKDGATRPKIDSNISLDKIVQEIKNKLVAMNFLLVRGVDANKIDNSVDEIVCLLNRLPANAVKSELVIKLIVLSAYQRDIEDGKGERLLFYQMIFKLYRVFPRAVEVMLRAMLPTDHACWKDVLLMIEKLDADFANVDWATTLKLFLFGTFVAALEADYATLVQGGKPSLASKWAPRQQSHFDHLAKRFASALFPKIENVGTRMKAYRQFLSAATRQMGTVESLMCGGNWDKINPGAVPSKAMKIYRLALQNKTKKGGQRSNDPKRVALSKSLIEFLSTGKKVNGKTLMVHEIIREMFRGYDDVLEAQLKSIVNDFRTAFPDDIGLFLPLADVSSSMEIALPGSNAMIIHVSIALAFLLSQIEGPFKDKVMTFHTDPRITDLSGAASLYEKLLLIKQMPWGGSTNFGKAMDYLLDRLKNAGLSGENINALNLVVFSDMQFNQADGGHYSRSINTWAVAQERIEEMYKREGFPVPRIIYWNLNASSSAGVPAHTQDKNVAMLSGFSQSALKTFLKGDILPAVTKDDEPVICPKKDPWEVLDSSLSSYVWLMQAFEASCIFPGYKAPVIEDEKGVNDEGWEHIQDDE